MADTTLEGKVDNLITDVAEIKTALKGYNGKQGLLPAFEKHCEQNTDFQKDYYKFKRVVITVFAFLVGSGVLGLSAVKIAEAVAKGGG